MSSPSYSDFCDSCAQEFERKNRDWADRFRIQTYPRWDYDSTEQLLVLSDASSPRVVCTYQTVGSLSNKTRTWLWAWANTSLTEEERERLSPVREYGIAHQIAELTNARFSAESGDAWTFAAIAGHLLGAQALYRPVADHLELYLLVMSTRWI